MGKKENIISALSKIYHHKHEAYLDHPKILNNIVINEDCVTCVFHELAGSFEINHLKPLIEDELFKIKWINELEIKLTIESNPTKTRHEGLKHVNKIFAVSSCKGGVGKSTIALNIATAFQMNGAKVGLFDADIHGPSLPTLITPTNLCKTTSDTYIPPFINNGIKLMSYGYVQESDKQPAILRGPIASNVFKQLLLNTDWGQLDILIIDCPPGTGDILLSITQEINLDSAIIITTPHELSYVDVKKGIEMFKKVNVPIGSIIENMSYFLNPETNEKYAIFGKGRLIPTAKEYNIPHWMALPINQKLAAYSNKQTPYLLSASNDEVKEYQTFANNLIWASSENSNEATFNATYVNDHQTIEINYKNNQYTISFKELRNECQCAFCVDEMTRKKILDSSKIDPNITISSLFNVGRYAIGIEWIEDKTKHQSMYPIESILKLCEMDKTLK